jgi:general secretion pathway protein N
MILAGRTRNAVALTWRFAALAVAAAIVALLLTLPSEQFGAPEAVSEPTNPRRTTELAAEAPVARAVDYPAIAEHPLFYPSRKPWQPPPPPAPAPPPPVVAAAPSPLTNYFLVGVVLSDSMRSALVRAQADKILTLSEGQEIDGWTLKEITPERLIFTAGNATYEMIGRKPSEIR